MPWGTQLWGQSPWGFSGTAPPLIGANRPTGVVTDLTRTINFSAKENGGAAVDPATINCTVLGEVALLNGVFQTGWSGSITANPFAGFDVSMNRDSALDAFSVYTVSASCTDYLGYSTTKNWFFVTEGFYAEFAEAVNERRVRVFFSNETRQLDPSAPNDALNPQNYLIEGGFRQLNVSSVASVDESTVDLSVPEMTDGALYTLNVGTNVAESAAAAGTVSEEELPSPRVSYSSSTAVSIELPYSALGNSVGYKLQDGTVYPFSGGATCSLTASGLNGLDTGSKAANTWYHLYLVPDGGILKPIFSASDPSSGPFGYSDYLPIMIVFNGDGDTIAEFDVDGVWCRFRKINDRVRVLAEGSWSPTEDAWQTIDLTDSTGWTLEDGKDPANFPGFDMSVIESIDVHGVFDEDSGNAILFLRGGNGTPTETPGVDSGFFRQNGHEFGALAGAYSINNSHIIAVPDGNLYYQFREASDSIDVCIRVVAFRHKYRVG